MIHTNIILKFTALISIKLCVSTLPIILIIGINMGKLRAKDCEMNKNPKSETITEK